MAHPVPRLRLHSYGLRRWLNPDVDEWTGKQRYPQMLVESRVITGLTIQDAVDQWLKSKPSYDCYMHISHEDGSLTFDYEWSGIWGHVQVIA